MYNGKMVRPDESTPEGASYVDETMISPSQPLGK
jgi:hypothetical protein